VSVYRGTVILDAKVTVVADGDTIHVLLPGGREERVRLCCVDTEESHPTKDKPATRAGWIAADMAYDYFKGPDGGFIAVDIEFDTREEAATCLRLHRDNHGRLLAYAHRRGENYNLMLVREGHSAYFVKYGRSRLYDVELAAAERAAIADGRGVFDPATNAGGPTRDYARELAWWERRAAIVEDFRRLTPELARHVLEVRADYGRILAAADAGDTITVLCDIQGPRRHKQGDGVVVFAGSRHLPLNLWLPDTSEAECRRVLRLIDRRYAGFGRGYVYATGPAQRYRDVPELTICHIGQLADSPQGSPERGKHFDCP
jgi:micrococcal nuclease